MDVITKANKILEYVENAPKQLDAEDTKMLTKAHIQRRSDFTNVLIDNIKSGHIDYEEAKLRAKKFSDNPVDFNTILAGLSDYEILIKRTASENKTTQLEVKHMDPIIAHLNVLAQRFPHWSRCLGEVLKDEGWIKDGWNMGTGGQAPADNTIEQIKKEEDTRMKTQTKEGESQMTENEKKKADHLRANDQSGKKNAWNLGTGDRVDSKKWDKGVDKEEEKRKGAEIKEGEKLMKEMEKKREEYLRAASKNFKVSLAKDEKNIRNSAWEIKDAKTSEVIVRAAIEDITDGNDKFTDEAIAEATSEDFGNLILENIGEHGIETTAKNMLGEDLSKFAVAEEGSIDASNKDTSVYNVKNYGATQGKGGKALDFGKTEEKEGGEAGKHVDAIASTIEKIASQYFAYRGIFADLKDPISDFAKKAGIHSVAKLLKKAEDALGEVKTLIDENAPGDDIMAPMQDAGAMLGQLNEVSNLIEQAKAKTDDPELLSLLDQIAAATEDSGGSDVAEGEVTIEESEPPAGEEEKNKEEDTEEEEEEENLASEARHEVDAGTTLKNKIKKLAAKGKDGKDYDIPQTHNLMKDFHGGEKGIQQDGAKFHNIWEIAKEIEAVGGKKAVGKLAAVVEKIKRVAEEKGVDPKKYFNSIFGDSKATSDYLGENTVEGVIKEWEGATKESSKAAYGASLVSKVKKAFHAALDMQKKGLLKEAKDELDSQVDRFVTMDDNSMNSYLDSLEKISATTEHEEGRIKVTSLYPAEGKFVVRAYVDNVPVANFSKSDLAVTGKVTRVALKRAAQLTKTALAEGMFDEVLADDSNLENSGETLDGMNLGLEETKLSKLNDIV